MVVPFNAICKKTNFDFANSDLVCTTPLGIVQKCFGRVRRGVKFFFRIAEEFRGYATQYHVWRPGECSSKPVWVRTERAKNIVGVGCASAKWKKEIDPYCWKPGFGSISVETSAQGISGNCTPPNGPNHRLHILRVR